MLSYSPSNENFDGSVRKILVRLKQKGFILAYRRSYVALDAPEVGAADRLERGAPLVRDLVFQLRVSQSGAAMPASPAQRRTLAGFEPFATFHERDKALLRLYSLQITADGLAGGTSASSSGVVPGTIEMGIDAYDVDNRLIWRERHLLTVQASETRQQANVLRFVQPVEIPSTAAWLRVGLQDMDAARVGSLEIPLAGEAVQNGEGTTSMKASNQ